jgi:membrane carboxypeptidase/penicillin-binding protein PbpC
MDPTQPDPWTAATMILDVRTTFTTHDGKVYTPKNYDGLEHGPVSARDALASSLNIPAVITLDHVGLERFAGVLERFGVETLEAPQDLDLSLALGGGSVSLLELTRAYAAFANTGYRLESFTISKIETNQGKLLYSHISAPKVRILDERLAWLMSDILNDKDARDIGFGKNTILQLDRPAAVKTGTTTNFHDNWTVGYTPQLVVGVWAGNADNQPMRDVTGLTGAAPIWHQFMRSALADVPPEDFIRPEGLVQLSVCKLSGLLPTPACPYQRQEWFIAGTQPQTLDTLFQEVSIDRSTGKLAGPETPPQNQQNILALDLPLQAENWASQHGYSLLSDIEPNPNPGLNGTASQAARVTITNPPQNALYRLSSKVPLTSQAIQISVSTDLVAKQVELWLDGELLARLDNPPSQVWWPLEPGQHHLYAQITLDDGSTVTSPVIAFEVEPAIK